ncbi:Surface cell-adhesion protein [Mycena kentingensis (nom. inval.)]|nr:Surface cell-adhesion protein [Mycena kentingensis (nom. inval.)]
MGRFDDYFVTSIGGSTQTDSGFWGLLIDYEFTPVGGCQQQISDPATREVLWAYDAFNAEHFLKLSGPANAVVGVPAVFTVTDGATMQAVAGAAVDESGATSGADGTVAVTFTTAGVKTVKAELAGSLRESRARRKFMAPRLVGTEYVGREAGWATRRKVQAANDDGQGLARLLVLVQGILPPGQGGMRRYMDRHCASARSMLPRRTLRPAQY